MGLQQHATGRIDAASVDITIAGAAAAAERRVGRARLGAGEDTGDECGRGEERLELGEHGEPFGDKRCVTREDEA